MKNHKDAIPTMYSGVQFKSRLEANIARFLTELGIKWEYEKHSYLLLSGHNMPDFYCPEIKTFVEGKGSLHQPHRFPNITWEIVMGNLCIETKSCVLLLRKTGDGLKNYMCEPPLVDKNPYMFYQGGSYGDSIFLIHCHSCKSFSFCTSEGSYHCRKCGEHNGDHDIIFDGLEDVDFSSWEMIEDYFNPFFKKWS